MRSIAVVTPILRLAKLLAADRRRVLAEAGVDGATLDLLSVLRRSGAPYVLGTRSWPRGHWSARVRSPNGRPKRNATVWSSAVQVPATAPWTSR